MRNCENKLMQFERKLEKVNASMVLLEAKVYISTSIVNSVFFEANKNEFYDLTIFFYVAVLSIPGRIRVFDSTVTNQQFTIKSQGGYFFFV